MIFERAEILDQLKDALERVTDGRVRIPQLEENLVMREDLGLYSLELIELTYELETLWNITVDDGAMDNLRTVGDVVDFIMICSNADASKGVSGPEL